MPHSHDHGHAHPETTAGLRLAFFLNLGFALLEIGGGLWTNSLAIISDALHDLGDSAALGLSWYLDRYSKRREDVRFTYGYRRFSLLGALVSALILIGGSVAILTEAIPRLLDPEPAYAPGMLGFAVAGIAVNGLAALRVRQGKSMNAQMVAWHLLEDVLGWGAVFIVSVILLIWDVPVLDPLLSVGITLYVLYNVVVNLRKTLALFLQAVPETIDIPKIEQELRELHHVKDIHHTHIWSLDGERHVLSTHVVIDEDATKETAIDVKCRVREIVHQMDLEHVTVEIEYAGETCSLVH